MSKLHLVLLVHAHQPVGNFEDVLERTYQRAYLPFAELLERHPAVRLGVHYSGPLLEWMERRHPEFFDLLRRLIGRAQIELVGGGFYEPILIAIPLEDRLEQLCRMSGYLERHFGVRPSGAWLAERVWEPQLPATLRQACVHYTLVDDIHFLAAGFDPAHLHGYYIAEELGATVKVIPGLKALRYLIPFRSVEETLDFLRRGAQEHPGGFASMGDDCEKFGAWPGTYEHCYRDGWLERFFRAIESNSDWLTLTPPGEFLASHPPLGRADLPSASYSEMMEWALPTQVRMRFQALKHEFASRPDVEGFLRGGSWRNFFGKYAEANLLHKKMLHVSRRLRTLSSRRRLSLGMRERLSAATSHLLHAQCNDGYWHGVFGGVYAPHLRTEVWRELIRAENLADSVEHGRKQVAQVLRIDLDTNGAEELYLTSRRYAALLKPSDGATVSILDLRTSEVTLINSLERRPEAYHARVQTVAAGSAQGVASIHEQARVKEAGLERRIVYDRWPRHAFRLLVFAPSKAYEDYTAVRLDEDPSLAAGIYEVLEASAERVELACQASVSHNRERSSPNQRLGAQKMFSFSREARGFSLTCGFELRNQGSEALDVQAGLEVVLNLLAPNEPDRYFDIAGERRPLGWGAAVASSEIRLVDEWQKVAVTLSADGARQFWIAPIETVSESEEGFERVYQGSQILPLWPVQLVPGGSWSARVRLSAVALLPAG